MAVQYVGRPGISPALAALISLGRIRHSHRILDVGCGTGTDAILLARWGFRRLDAIDPDRGAIAAARTRATRARLSRRVRFHRGPAERLSRLFAPKTFDVVLHTLVSNNLTRDRERHFREVASVLKPGGLLLLHERVTRAYENGPPGRVQALAALRRHFELGPGVATHLAEHPTSRKGPAYARVVLWLGRPKRRATPRRPAARGGRRNVQAR